MREAEINRAKDLILLDSFKASLKQKAQDDLKKLAQEKKPRSRTTITANKQPQTRKKPTPATNTQPQQKPPPQIIQPSLKDIEQPAETSIKAAKEDNKILLYMTNDSRPEDLQQLNPKSTLP